MLLSTIFFGNPLASRILQVLDRLIPGGPSPTDDIAYGNFESSVMDFSMWPLDTEDPLSGFGWPEFGGRRRSMIMLVAVLSILLSESVPRFTSATQWLT